MEAVRRVDLHGSLTMKVNEATGEVTATIGKTSFRLHATTRRFADFQAALDVTGLPAMWNMLQQRDPRAIYEGMRCLCSSDNAAALDEILLLPNIAAMAEAITAALMAGLPTNDGNTAGNG